MKWKTPHIYTTTHSLSDTLNHFVQIHTVVLSQNTISHCKCVSLSFIKLFLDAVGKVDFVIGIQKD